MMNALYKFFFTPLPNQLTLSQTFGLIALVLLGALIFFSLLVRFDEEVTRCLDWYIALIRKGKK